MQSLGHGNLKRAEFRSDNFFSGNVPVNCIELKCGVLHLCTYVYMEFLYCMYLGKSWPLVLFARCA